MMENIFTIFLKQKFKNFYREYMNPLKKKGHHNCKGLQMLPEKRQSR